jgi:hypothetical protein
MEGRDVDLTTEKKDPFSFTKLSHTGVFRYGGFSDPVVQMRDAKIPAPLSERFEHDM